MNITAIRTRHPTNLSICYMQTCPGVLRAARHMRSSASANHMKHRCWCINQIQTCTFQKVLKYCVNAPFVDLPQLFASNGFASGCRGRGGCCCCYCLSSAFAIAHKRLNLWCRMHRKVSCARAPATQNIINHQTKAYGWDAVHTKQGRISKKKQLKTVLLLLQHSNL